LAATDVDADAALIASVVVRVESFISIINIAPRIMPTLVLKEEMEAEGCARCLIYT
jgi:hypothetical protein